MKRLWNWLRGRTEVPPLEESGDVIDHGDQW